MSLHKSGKDADVTEKRQQALELIDHTERRGRNARQTMMMHKGGHGTGRTPEFPSREEIEANMEGLQVDHYVSTYGDGSFTTPEKGWCALVGIGGWIPAWNQGHEEKPSSKEKHIAAPANGQTGSSTRMELAAWIAMMTQPVRMMYATDSEGMLSKALMLLQAAKDIEEKEARGEKVDKQKPFKKPLGFKEMETSGG